MNPTRSAPKALPSHQVQPSPSTSAPSSVDHDDPECPHARSTWSTLALLRSLLAFADTTSYATDDRLEAIRMAKTVLRLAKASAVRWEVDLAYRERGDCSGWEAQELDQARTDVAGIARGFEVLEHHLGPGRAAPRLAKTTTPPARGPMAMLGLKRSPAPLPLTVVPYGALEVLT